MPFYPRILRRTALAAAAVAAMLALSASPASATICPGGIDPYSEYCTSSAVYSSLVLGDNPVGYFRLGDAAGSETMDDTSPNNHDGEFKNGQDSGPLGISGDGNTAREFWGQDGYGYVNGIPAPGNGYTNYTMEAWFNLPDIDADEDIHVDGTIMQHGGGGTVYILNNTLRFRNGPNDMIMAPTLFKDERWYHVVARKQGNQMRLYLNQSPTTATPWNYTPVASGTSSYRPGGTPTFYIGYGEYAPWLRVVMDEVAYYDYAVSLDSLALHFYADPPPDDLSRPAGVTPTPGTTNGSPTTPFSDNSSVKPKPRPSAAAKKKAKLKKAKAEVRRINKLIAKTKKWIGSLKHNGAPRKSVKVAQKKLRKLQKQLKVAKKRVKALS